MGVKPKGLTLDRIDVNGNYEKSNCQWTDWNTQANNKRIYRNNKTGVRCVRVLIDRNRYAASVTINNKKRHLGYFPITSAGLQAATEAVKKAKTLAKIFS